MRFGIIGAGRIGKIHGGNVAARPDSQVVLVADADPAAAAALAKATGAKVAEVDAILAAKDVDAVAICSPTDTHADLIERAARAGKAIFCEKPIDLDVERVRACLEVVKKAGVTLMVGFNRRFDPNFAALRRRVAEGAIGALEIVSITSRDPGPPPISYIARSGGPLPRHDDPRLRHGPVRPRRRANGGERDGVGAGRQGDRRGAATSTPRS